MFHSTPSPETKCFLSCVYGVCMELPKAYYDNDLKANVPVFDTNGNRASPQTRRFIREFTGMKLDSFDALEPQGTTNENSFDTLKPKCKTKENSFDVLEPQVITKENSFDALEPQGTTNENSFDTLKPKCKTKENSFDALEPQVTTKENSFDALEPQLMYN